MPSLGDGDECINAERAKRRKEYEAKLRRIGIVPGSLKWMKLVHRKFR